MDKSQIVQRITGSGLVVVVRAESAEQAIRIAEACREGGAAAIEITFTVPGALGVIERLANRFAGGEILVGAGTVLDAQTARAALLAGARYVVSPHFDPAIVALCHRYRAPVMPGTMSVTEIVRALESGADLIKVFPGDVLGPAFLRAVRGPLPHAPLSPSGGVTLENVADWIDAGAVALSVGRPLMQGIAAGDGDALAKRTAEFLGRIAAARARAAG
jgi:2-dehydro-3-deoxyphosphogluconate aldolase / (4S)-4-hydroxy-2-oxoglutarate aldolase